METAQSTAMARQHQIAAGELDAALSEGEIEVFLLSLQKLIRAGGGFAAVARKTGLNRSALYNTLSSNGNPWLSRVAGPCHERLGPSARLSAKMES